jgi:hypothetical protein
VVSNGLINDLKSLFDIGLLRIISFGHATHDWWAVSIEVNRKKESEHADLCII